MLNRFKAPMMLSCSRMKGVYGGVAPLQGRGCESRPALGGVIQVGDSHGLAGVVAIQARALVGLHWERLEQSSGMFDQPIEQVGHVLAWIHR